MKLDLQAVAQPIVSLNIKTIRKHVDSSDIFLPFADNSPSILCPFMSL
jgi:hypothetical protein